MAGRPPKEKSFANMLRIAVSQTGETGEPKLRELADKLVDCALKGEGWAMQQVADRLDGKPMQESTVTVEKRDATDWTRDELVAFLRDAAAGRSGTPQEDGRGGEPDSVH